MSANLVTFIARVTDSMLLVATMDPSFEVEDYKSHAKRILRTLTAQSPSRCTIEAGPYYFHYLIEGEVVYLCIAERGYHKKLAFQYLEELCRQFSQQHGHEVPRYSRPYAAVQFDPQMNQIRSDFLDPDAPSNVRKLNADLNQIHDIMCQNIHEVLKRGEKLENVQSKSSNLLTESKRFEKQSRMVNLLALYKSLGPVVAIVLVILLLVYYRFFR